MDAYGGNDEESAELRKLLVEVVWLYVSEDNRTKLMEDSAER